MQNTDRTWAEIHLDRLAHNYETLRKHTPRDCCFLAPVKANAYGHGAVTVSRTLTDLGCDYLAVACLPEALELRQVSITRPILIFGYTNPKDATCLVENHLTQAVFSLEQAEALSNALKGTGHTLSVHLELDTGMGRLGFPCRDAHCAPTGTLIAMKLPHLDIQGIFTHFAVADMDEDNYTRDQFETFTKTIDWLEAESGQTIPLRHSANSGGTLRLPETHQNMIRPGIALYGVSPNPELIDADLKPVMELKTRIIQVRDFVAGESISYGRTYQTTDTERIAVVPIGYADGLPRILSGKMNMLLQGETLPQVGRICMDMCMLNVSALKKVSVGDLVTIFGHDGSNSQSVHTLAAQAETIPYELLTRVAPRVPRITFP